MRLSVPVASRIVTPAREGKRNQPTVPTMVWPAPLPGRVRWAWLLGLPWRRRRVRRILSMLRGFSPPGGVLLDVGGASGVGAEEAVRLAPPGTYRRRIVLDPQRGMLVRARPHPERSDALDLVQGDAIRLPVPDQSVDVVLSLGVLCCMTDEAVPLAVSETWRVLRPEGLAVVSVPLRRGDADDPLFRDRGFRRVARLRPGRSLYQRPSASGPVLGA
jgi:SAM-dependent methyltransferase